MKWILVLVYIYNGQPYVEKIEEYASMYDCFTGFDSYESHVAKIGTQLVCIQGELNVTR